VSYGQKFALYAALYIWVFRMDHSRQGVQHFPSLHQTLSREDSEEIEKGINVVSNDRLNGFDNGFGSGQSPIGSDPALSGQVWIRYVMRACESTGPRRRPAGPRAR
jgi:hypothetical protein